MSLNRAVSYKSVLFKAALALLAGTDLAYAAKVPELSTLAERSGWQQTARYAEVERLCAGLAKAYPKQARCQRFGTTPEGRPMLAIIAGTKLKPDGRGEVVFFQGGIHAGEIAGKDAGLIFVRELLAGKRLPGILRQLTIVFVPVFNVDGHERFGPHNRPNQNGPEQAGWRTTAQNYNLNRDYMKVDAPEMAAMAALTNAWDPILSLDLHVTDGAQFQHDIAVVVEPTQAGPEPLKAAGLQLKAKLLAGLQASGHWPIGFYPAFVVDDDPKSGVKTVPQSAVFSNGYWALRNRLGILVEAHSWRSYQHRCQTMLDVLQSVVAAAAQSAPSWRQAALQADREAKQLAGKDVVLAYSNAEASTPLDFLGYAYERRVSEVSGKPVTIYHPAQPEVWQIPFWSGLEAKVTVKAPLGGYLIPPAYRSVVEPRLQAHGVQFRLVEAAQTVAASRYQVDEVHLSTSNHEGHQMADYQGEWHDAEAEVASGALWVPIDQPRARLILRLFEPASKESLFAWGFFNAVFERKEYMEPYVAEEVATAMLKDPAVQKEFAAKLAADAEFAQSAEKRLDFFYRRHPSFDDHLNRYPILRLRAAPK